ncbi:DUF4334 domain-containing protein [Pseudonocardia sp. HH130630-07]|uniref:DUF4334 domain-containing protein n=1 Tax=Pseudonocardia sp. HH130630-07 TaxID=1690815 RepID=UPI000814D729|nr:DUF4334 domain-containing protein [Pseudonocardia sp. HH130630-07]ANY09612.1 hypothetical protein AFB00_29050 [Pseudonocardia sp. HH130630-07]
MTTSAPVDTLRHLEYGATIEETLAFFDALPPVGVGDLLGEWSGGEIPTGNPMDGLLGRFGWHGKRFDGPDDVHPLVMDHPRGGRYSLNPALVPLPALLRHPAALRNAAVSRIAARTGPALATRSSRARLRMTEYRGVVSATMCYDDLPIHDVFHRVDEDTVLGLMDMRGLERPFVFFLCRE